MYGKDNTGPAREVWRVGDRVCWHNNRKCRGTVADPKREPNASQVGFVWIRWDHEPAGYFHPNLLDVA